MGDQLQRYEGAARTERFRDGENLNGVLQEMAGLLKPVQQKQPFSKPSMPVGCIVGNPRSGTTLFQQWMASLGVFSYPTNLLTRFAYAPYVGALIQKMLFDPDFDPQGDFSDLRSGISFESDLGKSHGALACNEFQHFFRNYMPNFDLQWLDDDALGQVDCEGILRGLASIESAFGKPFTTKGSILQFNISYMAERMPELFWMHIVREPIFNMQSIIIARERYYGNRNTWLSAKPKEYSRLKEMDVSHQVAGQVYFTERTIQSGLRAVPEKHQLTVKYESFCKDPEVIHGMIVEKYAVLGCSVPTEYKGQKSFVCGNTLHLPQEEIRALERAYAEFESGTVVLD